jgi:membrane protein implicated in regulation of membrane protease activity
MTRLPAALYGLIVLSWLGLLAYVWVTQGSWGLGWQLVGTINVTAAAALAVALVWLGSRVIGRFTKPSHR